ncbi:MAG TPA: hypothetical protein VFE58_08190 [Tepidisphaeraceae bacterium]|nr:hypothetical protein [Tepidisphaeraceae bacterium]
MSRSEAGRELTVFIGDGAGGEEGEGGEVMTFEAGEQFVVYRGMAAWVDPGIEVVDESPDGTFAESEEEGLLPRGRYRWTGNEIVYVGRQKGPARPM